ncbi:hypothetical protein SAMN06296378_2028 [Salinibacterium xinjiangense]|uniref:Uncharacterized protein n=1 Tax=Salinibacterium xinjiangense TaxID=386302 RepID=A0A2C8ZV63_9MICO|nr:hypothetical protein SAMN06296378_2028 [Salinibacterium xinjiangense]
MFGNRQTWCLSQTPLLPHDSGVLGTTRCLTDPSIRRQGVTGSNPVSPTMGLFKELPERETLRRDFGRVSCFLDQNRSRGGSCIALRHDLLVDCWARPGRCASHRSVCGEFYPLGRCCSRADGTGGRRNPSTPPAATLQNHEQLAVFLQKHVAAPYPVRMIRKPVRTALAAGRRAGDSGGLVTLIKLALCSPLS